MPPRVLDNLLQRRLFGGLLPFWVPLHQLAVESFPVMVPCGRVVDCRRGEVPDEGLALRLLLLLLLLLLRLLLLLLYDRCWWRWHRCPVGMGGKWSACCRQGGKHLGCDHAHCSDWQLLAGCLSRHRRNSGKDLITGCPAFPARCRKLQAKPPGGALRGRGAAAGHEGGRGQQSIVGTTLCLHVARLVWVEAGRVLSTRLNALAGEGGHRKRLQLALRCDLVDHLHQLLAIDLLLLDELLGEGIQEVSVRGEELHAAPVLLVDDALDLCVDLLLEALGDWRCAAAHEVPAHEGAAATALLLPEDALADNIRHAQLHDHSLGHLRALLEVV
mmetsp:Transcript_66652/g.189211  ORF Transcript_66652/g.189211 Transcript_66652/m.189211 type:complete len:330 (-) Transcript_66652:739-1728(-)